ncbi:ultraviolet-B receptor UVR8 [Tanacetum coccineum]
MADDNGRKVTAIAAGEAHTLALTGDGKVYSWGRGTFGRLGNASEVDQLIPTKIHFHVNKILAISAGAYHTIALADGQLGVDGDNSLVPYLVQMPISDDGSVTKNETTLKISSVKAGGMMSLAIDDVGCLWMWGNCPVQDTSNEGGFSFGPTPTPIRAWNFNGHSVVKVACGSEHIVALVNGGEGSRIVLYTWTESVCWTFGRGDNGQLGHGTTKKSLYPEIVKGLPENVILISVDCGLFHTSVVSSSGNVWAWGMENGLGLCPGATFTESDGGDALTPRLINDVFGSKFPQPVQVACGAAHTVLLADSGYKLWSWGRGSSGVLGNGQDIDFFVPRAVLWPPPGEEDSETVLYLEAFEEDRDVPLSLRNSGTFDIAKEWEDMLDSSDRGKLIRLQMFYRNMLAGVEDKMMNQRIGDDKRAF